MSQGKIICYIGRRGSGKTTAMMKATKSVPAEKLEVYDFHGDWERELIPLEDFISKCAASENKVFVFEDATSFFGSRVVNGMRGAMARSRGRNITLLLSFHSLRLFPLDIFDMCDAIVLFKTRDNIDNVMKKFDHPTLVNAFKHIAESSNDYANVLIDLNQ